MEIVYSTLMIIISVLIIVILIILIKTIFDIDKNVVKGKDIIENVSDITKNAKEEQEKIQNVINDKIDKVSFISKLKIVENLVGTISKIYKNKKKDNH
jgi:predicted PurR-regulated permease PerM